MALEAPFYPQRGAGISVTATTTSASSALDPNSKSVLLTNIGGTNIVYFRIGVGAQTATNADVPVLPNSSLIVSKGDGENTVAYVAAAATSAITVQTGEGGH